MYAFLEAGRLIAKCELLIGVGDAVAICIPVVLLVVTVDCYGQSGISRSTRYNSILQRHQ